LDDQIAELDDLDMDDLDDLDEDEALLREIEEKYNVSTRNRNDPTTQEVTKRAKSLFLLLDR
jgi:hypothetical protein